MCGPSNRTCGYPDFFCITQMAKASTGFNSQILLELLFSGLELWNGEPLCGARSPRSFGGVQCTLCPTAQMPQAGEAPASFLSPLLRCMYYDQLDFGLFVL